jgi:dTDP-4-dehydrorhamnose 3,5-epimerase
MKIQPTDFEDLFVLELFSFKDDRGEFVKTIHDQSFQKEGLDSHFSESFYSSSKKGVIRGMHFQFPPQDHNKLVYVIKGKIIDVILDLRKQQHTYGKYLTVELSEQNRKAAYMGKGFAHGFIAMEEDSIVEYHTSTSQSKEHEGGILWNSFGYEWPVETPIMSVRDQQFVSFAQFQSPF